MLSVLALYGNVFASPKTLTEDIYAFTIMTDGLGDDSASRIIAFPSLSLLHHQLLTTLQAEGLDRCQLLGL